MGHIHGRRDCGRVWDHLLLEREGLVWCADPKSLMRNADHLEKKILLVISANYGKNVFFFDEFIQQMKGKIKTHAF